ncbi:pyridoxal kinase [Breoghania sp. L-A4]|uniref:pyridoxal kinase n=1 Tax=Breoghania sp. L-A4 TaxID=2304600 RepID=UPI000E35BB5C|nr:pyridoxal kinase [Breoghania sp. L-A4]AXS42274.1 pyridoxal kinase [Breoghania sp. L-A4]
MIVATSQVVRGGVGGRAAVFALERLGFRVWFLPTVQLPWHPGHGLATRITPDDAHFCALVDDLINAPWLGEVGAVMTGYLGAAHQAEPLARLIAAVRARTPGALHLCDPVMGDNGALYVPPATADAIKARLVTGADIVTPNLFELGWLTGQAVGSEREAAQAARAMGNTRVMVTSSPALRRGAIATMLATPRTAFVAEHTALADPPHGTGDLIAALFLAHSLMQTGDEEALKRAASATFEVTARSVQAGADELLLAEYQQAIARPMAMVTTRRLATPRTPA